MKRPRVPYARRSVWTVITVLSVVLVIGFVIAGYEIHHLQNEVNGFQNLQNEVTLLQQLVKTK
jgi:type III secretory pathway component EscU